MAMQKGTKLAKLETQKTQDSKQTCKLRLKIAIHLANSPDAAMNFPGDFETCQVFRKF
jgi:hypothetical protein